MGRDMSEHDWYPPYNGDPDFHCRRCGLVQSATREPTIVPCKTDTPTQAAMEAAEDAAEIIEHANSA